MSYSFQHAVAFFLSCLTMFSICNDDRKIFCRVEQKRRWGHRAATIRKRLEHGVKTVARLVRTKAQRRYNKLKKQQAKSHLFRYIRKGDVAAVQALLKKYPDFIAARDARMLTPLHVASIFGQQQIIAILLQYGASVEYRGRHGQTPLHSATSYGHSKAILRLLEADTKLYKLNTRGKTPLDVAKTQEILDQMQANYFVSKQIGEIIYHGDQSHFQRLLRVLHPNMQDANKETMLHKATMFKQYNMVAQLLAKGACTNICDQNGNTPLHNAVWSGNPQLVKLLLMNRANPNLQSRFLGTPLHYAAIRGNKEIVQMLLAYGADTEVKDFYRQTPLHRAADHSQAGAIRLLLAKGANSNAKDYKDQTPLSIARNRSSQKARDLLQKRS